MLTCVAFLCVALAVGGSSTSPLPAAVARLAAIPVLGVSLWRLALRPLSPLAGAGLGLVAATALLLAAQMIPLPPGVWSGLPGRELAMETFRAIGIPPPWLPFSLAPDATRNALLALLPPAAMFCAVLSIDERGRRLLAVTALAMALASVLLGLLQVAGGPESPLRFHTPTSRDVGVGFFANRNHQASFLVSAIPLAALLAERSQSGERTRSLFWIAACFGVALVAAVGVAMTRSRAGVLLAAPALLGGLLVLRAATAQPGRRPDWGPTLALLSSVALAAGLVAAFALTPIAERFQASPERDARFAVAPVVAAGGAAFAPLGSGGGSFRHVYEMLEPPNLVLTAYVNHAHDEYLEIWLEHGLAGVALSALFAAWFVTAVLRGARGRERGSPALVMAGAAVAAIMLAHSAADYPLRTPGLATLFALACGLLAPPPIRAGRSGEDES